MSTQAGQYHNNSAIEPLHQSETKLNNHRDSKFRFDEKLLLISIAEQYIDQIEPKKFYAAFYSSQSVNLSMREKTEIKRNGWTKVTEQYLTAISSGQCNSKIRNERSLQQCWKNMKSKAKIEFKLHVSMMKTRGLDITECKQKRIIHEISNLNPNSINSAMMRLIPGYFADILRNTQDLQPDLPVQNLDNCDINHNISSISDSTNLANDKLNRDLDEKRAVEDQRTQEKLFIDSEMRRENQRRIKLGSRSSEFVTSSNLMPYHSLSDSEQNESEENLESNSQSILQEQQQTETGRMSIKYTTGNIFPEIAYVPHHVTPRRILSCSKTSDDPRNLSSPVSPPPPPPTNCTNPVPKCQRPLDSSSAGSTSNAGGSFLSTNRLGKAIFHNCSPPAKAELNRCRTSKASTSSSLNCYQFRRDHRNNSDIQDSAFIPGRNLIGESQEYCRLKNENDQFSGFSNPTITSNNIKNCRYEHCLIRL
ncbi:MAG: hypothetical protein MHMPM18_001511 [Marteilia pararefringens]